MNKELIPKGNYCYSNMEVGVDNKKFIITHCPYWSVEKREGHEPNIYKCEFLGIVDCDLDTLLFDMCKECGENLGEDE